MEAIRERYYYLFQSTKGLTLVAISMIALVTAIWGMLSGPMVEFGVRDFIVKTFGMQLHPADREGRIIILYHSIAMAVLAIEVYFITNLVKMKRHQQATINATITAGYLVSMIFRLTFAYFGHNFVVVDIDGDTITQHAYKVIAKDDGTYYIELLDTVIQKKKNK